MKRYDQVSGLSSWDQKIYQSLKDTAEAQRIEPIKGGSGAWRDHLAMAMGGISFLSLAVFVGISTITRRQGFALIDSVNDGVFYALLVFSGGLIAATGKAFWDYHKGLYNKERILSSDLDKAGNPGGPSTRIEITIQGRGERILDVPVPDYVLRTFAIAAVKRQPISEREWTGEDKMTPTQYRAWRDQLIERGFARWISPLVHRLGWELTEDGLEAMRELAEG